jgi:hypothetical protein
VGNIAGDSASLRDIVLQHGVMEPLLQVVARASSSRLSIARVGAWAISNLCSRGAPFGQVRSALPVLAQLVRSMDEEVLADTCRALCRVSEGSNDRIQAVIDSNVCGRVVELILCVLILWCG